MATSEEYHNIILNLFLAKLEKDYNEVGVNTAVKLADNIRKAYKVIDLKGFTRIVIISPLKIEDKILDKLGIASEEISSTLEKLTTCTTDQVLIEFSLTGKVFLSTDKDADISGAKENSIIYERDNELEYFHTKDDRDLLTPISGVESYFSPSTFKSLDEALEYYETRFARTSSCQILQGIWDDDNRIKIIAGSSEAIMRNSLCQFLRMRLRDSKEIMPEQNVNEKNPVDIRVTWNYTKHVALIEIKWLGKSVSGTSYSQSRALEGAQQLAEYLDDFANQNSTIIPKGYLVVFDGRRRKVDSTIDDLTAEDIDYYENQDITYNPKYDEIRTDFETPRRFFLKARLTD